MTQYFYNGVLLPALPEWDKETYPYAAIFHKSDSNGGVAPYYQFVATKEPITRYDPALGSNYYYRNNTIGWVYRFINDPENITEDTVWGDEHVQTTVFASAYKIDLIWTNHDIIMENDGSVYLAASDPIPVFTPSAVDIYTKLGTDFQKLDLYRKKNGTLIKIKTYKGE